MEIAVFFVFAGVVAVIFYRTLRRAKVKKRGKIIDTYGFPVTVSERVREKYPHLTDEDMKQVISALREYFHVCNAANQKMVSMPSQVVDVAWHEFILFTKKYDSFCRIALGRFLHHTPAEAMQTPTLAQEGIKRAWNISCQRAGISPSAPAQLPLLFAIDSQLKIPDGFKYALNCKGEGGSGYCASHIGCGSGCSGHSGSDSDGCGGGGCGGD